MIIYTFVATNNYHSKRDFNARYDSIQRAFFMPIRQVIDSIYNLLSAACLRWYLSYPHSNLSLCVRLFVGGEEGSRFFCSRLTNNLIMSKQTTTELLTVQITPAQAALLEFISHDNAKDVAYYLGVISQAACQSDYPDVDSIEQNMALMMKVYEIALENKAIKAAAQ